MKLEKGMNQYMYGLSRSLIAVRLKEISKVVDSKIERNLTIEKEKAEFEDLAKVSVRLFGLKHEKGRVIW